jgi:hypothetical protein
LKKDSQVIKRLTVTLLAVAAVFPAQALDSIYGAAGMLYSTTEFSQRDEDDVGYQLVLGHAISRQWYIEVGYSELMNMSSDNKGNLDMETNALYISALGKASNQVGELFYRIGVANLDVAALEQPIDDSCELGALREQVSGVSLCQYDEGILAGIIGLGFDFYIANKTFLRLEVNYFRGENDYVSGTAFVGIRYNFN